MTRPTPPKPPPSGRSPRARRRRWYTATAITVALAVLVALVSAGIGGDDDNQTAPAADTGLVASFGMLGGGTGSLADYRGQPLVVNFFASWCPACLAELPGFERVHQGLAGQVEFLGVNLQDRPEDGQRVVEQTGITYNIARDPDGTLFTAMGGFAMPTTVFIDADGAIVGLHGGEITARALRDRIDEVLLP